MASIRLVPYIDTNTLSNMALTTCVFEMPSFLFHLLFPYSLILLKQPPRCSGCLLLGAPLKLYERSLLFQHPPELPWARCQVTARKQDSLAADIVEFSGQFGTSKKNRLKCGVSTDRAHS